MPSVALFVESVLMPRVYKNQKVVTVSQSSKQDIIRLTGCKSKDIYVVSPGVNIYEYQRNKKTSYPSFIYLGRHMPYKNISVAIKAFAELRLNRPNAKFIIAGEGESTGELKNLVKLMNLGSSIIFLGKVTEKQKIQLLGRSWAAVQPSSFEGWGITVIEANACGMPVIASHVNGLKDSVIHKKTGILVPVKSVSALSKAMEEMVADSTFRSQLSEEAFLRARGFDWDTKAQVFYRLLQKELGYKPYPVVNGQMAYSEQPVYE